MFAKLAINRAGLVGLRLASLSRNARHVASDMGAKEVVLEWQNLSKLAGGGGGGGGSQDDHFLDKATAIKGGLEAHLRDLDSANLIACVERLADWDCVRETIRGGVNFKKIMADPKFEERARGERVLLEIAALLDAESFCRLWYFTENDNTYINDTRVLVDLSKAWTSANTQSNRWASFPANFIFKWYVRIKNYSRVTAVERKAVAVQMPNQYPVSLHAQSFRSLRAHETRSRRLFKDIEPDLFVQVMEIMFDIRTLDEKCHKYYAFYKFYDLLDKFTLREINAVLRTFCKHRITTHKVR